MTLDSLSLALEEQLVARNLRRMQELRQALESGYCLRAARILARSDRVILGTGFPVEATFETDGPLGAIALYAALEALGKTCYLACADPLAKALGDDYRILQLKGFDHASGRREAQQSLARLSPDAVVSIERPGFATDGRYYNMRGEDISARCAVFDYYLELADCPSIAIGDGGNEIGMGKLHREVSALDIHPAATSCDELLVADVSNWGAYALVGMLEALTDTALLAGVKHHATLAYLSARGSVDGVTRQNTLTEDGLPGEAGAELLEHIESLVRNYQSAKETNAE
jgi:hypothetical protein